MSTNAKPPSQKQLRYLRGLADSRGETFAYPATSAQASAEIERLRGRRRSSSVERQVERLGVSREMAARGGAAAVRDSEIVGYGASAHWAVGER